jgi:hypothetical protein
MRKLRGTLLTLLVATSVLAGCGDEEKERAVTATPAPKAKVPAELAGTWTATVKGTELGDLPPAALRKKELLFRIKFLETGGVDNGPVMFLQNDDLGLDFANHMTEVSADRIAFGDCRLEYAVEAERLTLTSTVDDCPGEDDEFRTVLTTGPWRRTTG